MKFKTPGGKIVYGGGGIIPDVFVPINLKMENETINRVLSSGIMNYFVFEDLDKHRNDFKGMPKSDFIANFEVTDEVLDRFNDYLNQRARYNFTFVAYREEMKLHLKAILAEQLYGSEAYVQVLNTNDSMLAKVLELAN